jgi:hypothetical protein
MEKVRWGEAEDRRRLYATEVEKDDSHASSRSAIEASFCWWSTGIVPFIRFFYLLVGTANSKVFHHPVVASRVIVTK